jgi:hypothetical protein
LAAFGDALGRSDVFLDCAVNQLWTHMVGHRFRSDEVADRRRLLAEFKASGLDFKALIRAVALSDAYRARTSMKLMERELYSETMKRITGVRWTVGKRGGFDAFYGKVGGMDYRVIESRDRTPSQGHSLVQLKAAAETCDQAVDADADKARGDRDMLSRVGNISASPSAEALTAVLDDWYWRIYSRPAKDVSSADRELLVDLFREVEDDHGPRDGYKAVCSAFFASAEFAIY